MYVFGGNTTKASFNDLWAHDVQTGIWEKITTDGVSPPGRVGHTITALGARLFILGGREYAVSAAPRRAPFARAAARVARPTLTPLPLPHPQTNFFDATMHCINLRTLRWSQVSLRSHSPSGSRAAPVRTGHCATVHAGKLLLFGGLRDDGRFLDDITTVELIA